MARRWAAMIWSTSPASSVRTPTTARTFWIGRDTDTTRPPEALGRRSPLTTWPVRAALTSRSSAALASAWRFSSGFSGGWGRLRRSPPRFLAGGRTLSSTRSATR